MSTQTIQLEDTLHDYLVTETLRESALLQRLRAETARLPQAGMQISPEQGQFMAVLVRLLGARRVLEVGTFTGYSALCLAGALPADGQLVACDQSDEWTAVARRYWQEAGLESRMELRLGDAHATLAALVEAGETFDLVFIDADKTGYDDYYEKSLQLVRAGGVILFDNALMHGNVANPEHDNPGVQAMRALNRKLRDDDRVDCSLLPIGDGLHLVRKRG